jgi:cytochrome P450
MPEAEPVASASHIAELRMTTQGERTNVWQTLRSSGDVFEASSGTWMLTSPEAVQYAHRNPQLFSSVGVMGAHDLPIDYVPSAIDPPDHQRYRRILDPMLAPRIVNAMEPQLRAQLRERIAGFASSGGCDAMQELAVPYPTSVFLTVFGLPLSDREQLISWVRTMIEKSPQLSPDFEEVSRAAAWDFFNYLERYVAEKRERPADDMLSQILAGTGDDALTDREVIGLCILFALAGLDTVTGAIGFMLFYLARNPEVRHQVIADPDLVNPMIEEVLRLEPPAPMFPRLTTQDVEVCGVRIPKGARVMLCLATVNRDAERYDHPDEIDFAQADRGHVTFGGGIHRCLGSHLARRELRLVAEELHAAIPDYEVAPGFEPEIMWPSGTLHLRSLPLLFSASAGGA